MILLSNSGSNKSQIKDMLFQEDITLNGIIITVTRHVQSETSTLLLCLESDLAGDRI
ncbi:hypothetical protein [Clostridium botulinum]|uniref:hypothetical protein n=1 Tax=Clostridium botulinum TaxID=1491 RepID=UPI000AD1F1E3|nr:hypothetical protein [Clostridium botulinum]